MHDRYHQFACTAVGQRVLGTLNLPTPLHLQRGPFDPRQALGPGVLVGGTRDTATLRRVLTTLQGLQADISLPESNQSLFRSKTEPGQQAWLSDFAWIRLDKPRSDPQGQIRAVVFDATELQDGDELTALYRIFHPVIDSLAPQARLLVLGRQPSSCRAAEAAASQEGLQGFVRSLARELGPRGTTVNLVYLVKPAACELTTTLAYFLGPASAFVSGQAITLRANDTAAPLASLEGKTAIVTGAARGIGASIAASLHHQGVRVIGLDISENQALLEQTLAPLHGTTLLLDVAAADAADRLQDLLERSGHPLDIIIHNAGITRDKTLRKMSPSQWTQVLDVNLNAIMKLNRRLLDQNLIAPHGRIVCLASIAGVAGNFGQTNYATAKAALSGYVRFLARKLPSGMTANAVAPGFIETAMTQAMPLATREIARRINSLSQGGLPADIAEAVTFLCHPGSTGITGQTLRVCGQNPLGR